VILFPDKWSADCFAREHKDLDLHLVSPHDLKPAQG
jgi:hypothetical protein